MHRLGVHLGPRGQGAQQRQVGGQAGNAALGQRAARAPQRVGKARRRAVHDELGQQCVVVRRGAGTRRGVAVDADARPGGPGQCADAAAARLGAAVGRQRLGVDAPLHGVAARRGRGFGVQPQVGPARARRQADLRLHQIDTEHLLGDGVLDLQARVGLDEDVGQRLGRRIDEELEGAQAFVAQRGRHAQGVARDALAQRLRQAGAGGDFHQLLEAPLQRAFALAQRQGARTAVAQHLHFDVARTGHQALDVHAVDAEGRAGLAAAARVGSGQLGSAAHRAHAAPAAAAHGLDHDAAGALSPLRGEEGAGFVQRHGLGAAGHQRHAAFLCQRAGARLVAQQRELRRRGADEAHTGIGTGQGEGGVLAQEAVARVQRVAALGMGDTQQLRAVQVGGGAAGLQRHGHVGSGHMRGLGVVLRVHGDAGHAQLLQRTHQAQRDFATVGDQDSLEHSAFDSIAASACQQRGRGDFHAMSRSRRRSTLPAPVAGRASRKRTSRGTL